MRSDASKVAVSQRSSSACIFAFKSIGHWGAGTSTESWAGPSAEDAADGREGGASWSGEGESALLSYCLPGKWVNHNGLDQTLCVPVRNRERSITFLSSLMFGPVMALS